VVNRAKVSRSAAGYDDYYVPIQPPAKPESRPAQRQVRRKRPPRAGSRR
jgi:hypothetical protein